MTDRSPFEVPLYREQQRFASWGRWVVALAFAAPATVLGYGTYQQFVLGRPWGDRPISNDLLIALDLVVIIVGSITVWIFTAGRLDVTLTRDRLDVNFFPFRHKRIPLADILSAQPRTFSPLAEYGGWGLRWSVLGNGWGYFLRGNRGVQLVLRDRSKMLVGSQQPDQLSAAIHQAQPSSSANPKFGATAS